MSRQRVQNYALIAATILTGFAIRYWAASQWMLNFDSDEAIFGLMARHIAAGNYTPIVYGTEHLGSIESILAAGLFQVIGESVITFRLAALLFMLAFFILHAIYVTKRWGTRVAFLSLFFLIFPGFHILAWSYQPIGSYAALLALGTLLLLLESLQPRTEQMALVRYFGLGLVGGLGLWANQMFIVYILAVLIPMFMNSDPWKKKYFEWAETMQNRLSFSLDLFLFLSFILLFGLGTLAFFSSGCEPRYLFTRVSAVAKVILAASLILTFFYTYGKRALNGNSVIRTLAFFIGTIAGYSPQWITWISEGLKPVSVIRPSCPIDIPSRVVFTIRDMLPAMWGFPTDTGPIANTTANTLLWWFVGFLTIAALAWFMFHHRITIITLFRGHPIAKSEIGPTQVLILFLLPIMLGILGSNTVDIYSVRHLLVSWHASAIMFALFINEAIKRKQVPSWPTALFWVLFVGVTNIMIASRSWNIKFTTYDDKDVASLESFLVSQNVTLGYADYWGAFTLDFLTKERLIIAPYNGLNRIPSYSKAVIKASPITFIFPHDHAPSEDNLDALCDYLSREHMYSGEGPAKTDIIERCRSAVSVSRAEVANWEVWIITDQE